MVIGATVFAILLGLAASVIIPPLYRARASFIANSSSTSKLQGALGGTSGLGGIISQLGGSVGGDPSESPNFYVHLLASRELLTRLLESKFADPRTGNPRDSAALIDIMKIRNSDPKRRMELAVKQMTEAIKPGMDTRTNLVWFTVDARWGELSAEIANRLTELVSSFDREIRVSRAKSLRMFLQMRHDSAHAALRQAEENQRIFYERNRGFISASPGLRFEEQRITREVDLASDLYVSLDKQLEVARIDEINDAALITIIDSAVVPRKALWPRYWVTLFTATAVGLLFGLIIAGSATILADWRRRNPSSWAYLKTAVVNARSELRANLGFRRKPAIVTQDIPLNRPRVPDEPAVNTQRPA